MDKKVIIGVVIAAAAVILCVMVFTSVPQTSEDNVVELDEVIFNTTDTADFAKTNERNDSAYHTVYYTCGNSYVNVVEFNGDISMAESILNAHTSSPSKTVNGVTVYTESGSTGEDSTEDSYVAIVQDSGKLAIVGSGNADETAKMASSLKFK